MRASTSVVGLLLCSLVSAVPTGTGGLGIHFDGEQDAPLLKLDYATHRGVYDKATDVYVFKNIRFAAPPVGSLRWEKPAPPLKQEGIQDGKEGRSCTQQSMGKAMIGTPGTSGEDCLFLDVTVPGEAIRNPSLRLPVVNWVYGGAYVLGSKEQRGGAPEAMVRASKGNLIWVAGNYRLGVYGFAGGTTVEKEGVPNAGFHDQRAVLQWIQKYIELVGGDKTTVTAMGISAGAGSILHHLILEGGKLDPLFKRAILQSPGYMNLQDRVGQMEDNFKKFEDYAGCKGKGLTCLRAASASTIKDAADRANALARAGSFTFGPGPDGKFIVNTPTLELAAGRFWKGLEAVISSRVTDEGTSFVGGPVTSSSFDQLVDSQFGNSSFTKDLKVKARSLYPPLSQNGSPYRTELERLATYVTESSFTCHNRIVADAYAGKVYSVEYAVSNARHGGDQADTFFNPLSPQNANISADKLPERIAFQSYIVSFARSGNPNTYRNNASIEWPLTTNFDGPTFKNVLKFERPVGPSGFSLQEDKLEAKERCQFWTDVQKAVQQAITPAS